ncbi:TlpA family protein disulfide reductase [Spirosoma pollinicola]|uniref:Thioredoxin domain-containing protein n=1 Tax=Spirosoma pollinicola TaxID=2057025 RepID=A0A2K8YXL9_9BACT|nr:TlpA disulfide reductase family protein [Spirosoma pollinicola]AUD02288.1 hypothetical protein CWM47_10900 [Spirosoma pollinicola]
MKKSCSVLFGLWLIASHLVLGQSPADVLNLPITVRKGYGPFGVGFSRFTPDEHDDSNWSKLKLPVKGIPATWTNVQKGMGRLNTWQLIYQNTQAGKVPRTWYEGYLQNRQLSLDETRFSRQPIKCYVYLLKGFDQKRGKWVVMVDTNNNLDFSDETPFEPEPIKPGVISEGIDDAHLVTYQTFQKGKIITSQIPIVVKRMGDDLFFNFPQYAETSLKQGAEQIDLVISNGFLGLNFAEITTIARKPRWFWQTKIDPSLFIEIGDIITIGGRRYRNKGVNTYLNTLELAAVTTQSNVYSLKPGEYFLPFVAPEFSTGRSISLTSVKGKWVYIDFWGTWCKPCVEMIPTLKKLYQGLDKSRFEFIGIAGNQSPEQLRRFIKKNELTWPQILSTDNKQLIAQYHINSYPTSVLLDPSGKIIAKDLSLESLSAKLKELNR